MKFHSFHIPVMGIGFTVDTPVKVAHYGISSVISLVDDILIEKMREFYCNKINIPFQPIGEKESDQRARRITAYLNLVNDIVQKNFSELKSMSFENGSELIKYLEMLPSDSDIRKAYDKMIASDDAETINTMQQWIKDSITAGSIDVNIMTKLDKTNYSDGKELSFEYNDACAALRGFALSNLNSSIVLSAGINSRLYSYMAEFGDFYPDEKGFIKKKIILKVSDYRSALTQSKFLAKKGLWISEFRIESGLNCGGHAFATQGYLMGPIMEEFKKYKDELINTSYDLYKNALKAKNIQYPHVPFNVKVTVQGGIGTAKEHDFMMQHYNVDSVGWGTPFLLVPEVVNVDEATLDILARAEEEDLYLSGISPLGVPFNTVKGNTKDIEKMAAVDSGKPGSICTKRKLVSNTEFTERPICTASRQYQKSKIEELEKKSLPEDEYRKYFNKIVEKACICVGLGTPALLVNKLDTSVEGTGVSVCPGPNMAYFSKIVSLKEMVDHIYGRINLLSEKYRPNLFIKELEIYVDYFKEMVDESIKPVQEKQVQYLNSFRDNLMEGIEYYKNLFSTLSIESSKVKSKYLEELDFLKNRLSGVEFIDIITT